MASVREWWVGKDMPQGLKPTSFYWLYRHE